MCICNKSTFCMLLLKIFVLNFVYNIMVITVMSPTSFDAQV